MKTSAITPVMDPERVRKHLRDRLPLIWGAQVSARMAVLGLTNAQLAALSGTTPQTMIKVRNGEIMPRLHLRFMIAAALGTTERELFPSPSMADLRKAVA